MKAAEPENRLTVFGPVPSRRLGRSLGINNIPPKTCSYSCVYCQLGRTDKMLIQRSGFFSAQEVQAVVGERIRKSDEDGEPIEFLTFVPDGEPTLDANLGESLRALRSTGKPTAVITNASLLWMPEVRDALQEANWVSLKVDSVHEATWRRIDRPHKGLSLNRILDGVLAFARTFRGHLATETMLVRGINDSSSELQDIAAFIGSLNPATAYILAPTRPPAEHWVELPTISARVEAHEEFSRRVRHVELLAEYEGNAFAANPDVEQNILDTTSVHPMREEAVKHVLEKSGANWNVVEQLVAKGLVDELQYHGHVFYVRRLPGRNTRSKRGSA